MDADAVAAVSNAALLTGTYLAAAAGSGVVGNGSYDGLRGLVGWFRRRGVEPDTSWAEAPLPEEVLAGIGEIDVGTLTQLIELTAQARVEVGPIGGNHAHVTGDDARVTQIGTVTGPLTIN